MRLVDLQACSKSQVAGSNRFQDIVCDRFPNAPSHHVVFNYSGVALRFAYD